MNYLSNQNLFEEIQKNKNNIKKEIFYDTNISIDKKLQESNKLIYNKIND